VTDVLVRVVLEAHCEDVIVVRILCVGAALSMPIIVWQCGRASRVARQWCRNGRKKFGEELWRKWREGNLEKNHEKMAGRN